MQRPLLLKFHGAWGSAQQLPFADQSFDVVVSQFGLMFFPDPVRALQEMQRVLMPRGRIAVAVWDTLERVPAMAQEVMLLERLAGRAAADALRAPFVLGDSGTLMTLAHEAGMTAATVHTHIGTGCFPSLRTLVEADLRGWLPVMGVMLEESLIETVLSTAEKEMASYVNQYGQAVFEISAHVLCMTKP